MRDEPAEDEDENEDAVSGMPEGEPELTPMGLDPEITDEDPSDEDALPGFPTEGQPDVSG